MEKRSANKINAMYQSPEIKNWKGRATRPDLGTQYWYQKIELLNDFEISDKLKPEVALIGYVCDEGVDRNHGRIGAKYGAEFLRKNLGKTPVHFETRIADMGDIVCVDNDMESCQELLSVSIEKLIVQGVFPIAIGGGHDIAYGHFKGIQNAIKNKKIGIINFDAHFDLRSVEKQSNSGTPFNQILSEYSNVDYFAIGIQKQSNTKELFEIANKYNVKYIENDACDISNIEQIKQQLNSFIKKNDCIYITIDMDGFSSAYVTGVSAPSPLGFSPLFVFKLLQNILQSKKVISCDIAEYNPKYDTNGMTGNLVAKLVDFIVSNYFTRSKRAI